MVFKYILLDIDKVIFDIGNFDMDKEYRKLFEIKFGDYMENAKLDIASVRCFDKCAIENLNYLIDEIKKIHGEYPRIILHSHWRTKGDIEYLRRLFDYWRFSEYLFDKVPDHINHNIGKDLCIKHYLKENDIKDYVMLDDDVSLTKEFPRTSVTVNSKKLLTSKDVNLALDILQ